MGVACPCATEGSNQCQYSAVTTVSVVSTDSQKAARGHQNLKAHLPWGSPNLAHLPRDSPSQAHLLRDSLGQAHLPQDSPNQALPQDSSD